MVHISSPKSPTSTGTSLSNSADVIRAGAGRCVACGLCLPHCPTYRKTKSELESPRGRLALMLGVAKGELEPTRKLESHLSLCLVCRACETACPAQVPFGDAMDAARAELRARRPGPLRHRLLRRAAAGLANPAWLAFVSYWLRFYQRTGLRALLRYTGVLALLGLTDADAQLPRLTRPDYAGIYPAQGEKRGAVGLFLGCVARLTDARTLHDAVHVLTRLGYEVWVPPTQACCGALYRHAGDTIAADTLMRENLVAFADLDIEAIITTASGCGAMLAEYRGGNVARDFAAKVIDISSFLRRVEWPADVTLRPLAQRVAVQDPCTLTNVMRTPGAPYDMLRRIPDMDVIPLPDNTLCCGAAGSYHLEHKDMARSLRDDKLEHLRRLKPDILVSANVGCAMHLTAGIRAEGLPIEVVHPVTLIARQLE
jgi:glycolate oxidase iron-sulfur subunit